MEEEIQHATIAKLEGFITIKTRPINNSASKRANWAPSKVKSIIEWIKMGGKNNRAALERLEKRYRDQFRNKAHKNHGRKRKEGIVQYIPQWDKRLWVVLYPYRTTYTDQWGDSYIYSNNISRNLTICIVQLSINSSFWSLMFTVTAGL